MNIAIVTYALQVGGVETFIRLLTDHFSSQGHHVVIVETQAEGSWSKIFRGAGYNVTRIFANPLRSRRHHAISIARFLSDFHVAIINDAPFAQASLGYLPDSILVIPVLHNTLDSMLKNAAGSTGQFDCISVVSPALHKLILKHGVDVDNVVCIPNGTRVPTVWPKQSSEFDSRRPFSLIYLGTINHKQKGVLYLPEIYARIIAAYHNITFDIIGDGPDLIALKKRFSDIDAPYPVFHGALPNDAALALLTNADALIMPSHFEGLALTMLEAMAHGVVPIVSRLEDNTDYVITHGVDGLLVPISDTALFSSMILDLAQDLKKMRSISLAAWQTATSRFSDAVMAQAYLALIHKFHSKQLNTLRKRSGKLDESLLGDFPYLPVILVRPVRKILRMLRLKS